MSRMLLALALSLLSVFSSLHARQFKKVDDIPCQIHDITFSPNDRFLVVNAFNASANKNDFDYIDAVQIWKRRSHTKLGKIADIPTRYFLSGYCVSPDSQWVVATSEQGYRFHSCETGKEWPRNKCRMLPLAA